MTGEDETTLEAFLLLFGVKLQVGSKVVSREVKERRTACRCCRTGPRELFGFVLLQPNFIT